MLMGTGALKKKKRRREIKKRKVKREGTGKEKKEKEKRGKGRKGRGGQERRLSCKELSETSWTLLVLIPLAALLTATILSSYFLLDFCDYPLHLTFVASFIWYLSLVSP